MSSWNELQEKIGKTAADAVRKLYDYYGTDWIKWMANLYDGKTGCFYYANSSRDYDTVTYTKNGVTATYDLLPDAESTWQALDMLEELGLFKSVDNDWSRALPKNMRERCLKYIQNMQDEGNGYFYHPQWGKEIGHARIGRDYTQCLSLIKIMGGEPLYKTATERIKEKSSGEQTKANENFTLPAHLQSAEALCAYIDNLYVRNNFHGVGHILSSQTSQIKAAGLAEACIAHLDTYQSTETGYWDEGREHEYDKISAIIKIGALYSGLGGRMKYMEKVIDSAIDTILSERVPDNICFVFNSIGGLGTAVGNVRRNNNPDATDYTNIDVVMKKIYERLPEMIDATIRKLELFRHPDGSFSYNCDGTSLVDNQGVFTSRGYNEGDINGTTVAIYYVLNSLFPILGATRIPLLNEENYREFIEIINRKTEESSI